MRDDLQPLLQVIAGALTYEFSVGSGDGLDGLDGGFTSAWTTQEFRELLDASDGQGRDSYICPSRFVST